MGRNALLGSDDLLEVVTDQMTLHAEVQGHRVRVLVGGEVNLAAVVCADPVRRPSDAGVLGPAPPHRLCDVVEVSLSLGAPSRSDEPQDRGGGEHG